MKILVIQEYGIGNAILATPLLKTLARNHDVDMVLNSKRVSPWLLEGVFKDAATQCRVVRDLIPTDPYDIVIYCHPPGRLRPRPGQCKQARVIPTDPTLSNNPYPFRFSKHEVLSLLELADGLADKPYDETLHCVEVPPVRFTANDKKQIVIGIGYLKSDPFWAKKHFGNENYAQLINEIQGLPTVGGVILVGDGRDKQADGNAIVALTGVRNMCGTGLSTVLSVIMGSDIYVGNDTGLMHVAAAYSLSTVGIFHEGVSNPAKNAPWCVDTVSLVDPLVPRVVNALMPFIERV